MRSSKLPECIVMVQTMPGSCNDGHFRNCRVSPGRCLLLPGPCAEGRTPKAVRRRGTAAAQRRDQSNR